MCKKNIVLNLLSSINSLESFPIPISIIDLNFQITNFSQEWSEEFFNAENYTELHFNKITTIPNKVKNIVKQILNGETEYIKTIEIRNNQNRWFRYKFSSSIEDTKIIGAIVIAENITEQKREKQLLKNAKKVAGIGSWELDLNNNTVYWSGVTKKIHEVPSNFVPTIDGSVNFYKAGKNRNKITKYVSDAITDGKNWDAELIIITANNNEKWVRAKGETEFSNGKCVRVFGTFQDIHEQKVKDLEYIKLTNRLKIATKTAKIGIWEYDYKKEHLFWSDEMFGLYQKEKSTFTNQSSYWDQCLHPDDFEYCQNKITTALIKKEDFELEFRIINPNGEVRNIKSSAYIEVNSKNNVTRLVGANWDITELKYAKLKLSNTQDSLQQAFENSSVGMALISLEGKWIDVNASLCNSVGYTRQEMVEKKISEITHPEDLIKDSVFLKQMHEGKIANYTVEKRFYHKKGPIVHAILTVTTVKKVSGNLSHFIAQLIDVSPMIKSKNDTKALLDITKNQNNSLLNFAHIVSHNLRSHSTNLLMLTNFIQKEKDAEEKKELETMLLNASKGLNETVHHLNEVVQITTDTNENLKNINLLNSINRVKKNISAILEENNTTCIVHIPKDLKVKAVLSYLDSILLNLFTNSVKYKSPKRKLIIEISYTISKDNIVLHFADNGQGIDLERHGKKLFGMYKTFHQHEDAKGIGLFITKNQIEAMNGSITVDSKVDQGALFILTFAKPTYSKIEIA